MRVLVVHGPNLNLLGVREPHVYGSYTLEQINDMMQQEAESLGIELRFVQSNHEGELIGSIHEALNWASAIILNPAGYTHTSIAIHDAIVGSGARVIEVHISNVYRRERFRQHSYVSPAAAGIIVGFGVLGYPLALRALASLDPLS